MKSSKYVFYKVIDIDDVNKALNEMHDEVDNKVATKEFRDALNE